MAKKETKLEAESKEKDIPSAGPLDLAKTAEMTADSKEGRRLKFIPTGTRSKAYLALVGVGGFLVFSLLLVLIFAGGGTDRKINTISRNDVEQKDLEENNNSEGYLQSRPGDFGDYSLDLNLAQNKLYKSENIEVGLNEQASLQDGFLILAVSVDRDYRPASEFSYKRIAESGDELVRVNFIIGNATNSNMQIGYNDLALYSVEADGSRKEAQRVSEDIYSPKDGQVLGGKQSRRVSLHYRVKRSSQFFIEKTKIYEQRSARERDGEEKTPKLYLKINLK
jgi:hypothetical protein